jgi:hypothetical protein
MPDPDPASPLSPEDRRREVVDLLAVGLLRLFRRLPPPPSAAVSESELSARNELADAGESRPHGPAGTGG